MCALKCGCKKDLILLLTSLFLLPMSVFPGHTVSPPHLMSNRMPSFHHAIVVPSPFHEQLAFYDDLFSPLQHP
ncbi:hypothetical protein KC19_VG095300 [Ceratodon purpureus]|uniref:Uncharacterized protein n=1 Tax=Ceratodon purpureus TaxID=3225 RepID=A0A8T0HNR6_CERPU|nr:hypothetical protein KC19_VG095300 [Ceratodon purpureus]